MPDNFDELRSYVGKGASLYTSYSWSVAILVLLAIFAIGMGGGAAFLGFEEEVQEKMGMFAFLSVFGAIIYCVTVACDHFDNYRNYGNYNLLSKYGISSFSEAKDLIHRKDNLEKRASDRLEEITKRDYLDRLIKKSKSLSTNQIIVLNELIVADNIERESLKENLQHSEELKHVLTLTTE